MDAQDTPELHYNHGNTLYARRRLAEALAAYDLALARDPRFALAWNNRALVLRELGRPDDAIASISRAIAAAPTYAQAWFNRATVSGLDKKNHLAAAADLRQALALMPDMPYAPGLLLHFLMQACDWRDFDRHLATVDEGLAAGVQTVEPFAYLAMSSSPANLRRCAERHAAANHPPVGNLWRPREHDRIRLGYVAAEFRDHATALLTARLFELHDRERFEVIAVDTGTSAPGGALRARLEKTFDRWLAVGPMDDEAAASRIAEAEIDILVDLSGYANEARMGLFARRPAPVQVNWLGMAGTLGAPYMDYILADRVVIPPEEAMHYTEQVARLPHSYQVNDDRREIADEVFRREGCGLPADGFVFCNFNAAYKITPETFSAWMRILSGVPGSVLWLLQANSAATANLRAAAKARGVAPERLVFAPFLPPPRHLARLKLADLYLDSAPYNAHTSASDALWAGVPLLTWRGSAFAGRVGESLLRAVGLPELVGATLEDFEAEAIALARAPERLAVLRARLAANRNTAPLFDSARFTRDLEAAYTMMWERFRRGEPAQGFAVEA